jgi:NDP-sugar pyrophosphorylase family protein
MVIELSLPKNDNKEKLSIVILCAGEGTRLKKITETLPKPLIKIEKLGNISILHYLIKNLLKLEVKQIGIVIGHLGNVIRRFILTLEKNNQIEQNKVKLIDSEDEYRLGPLFTLLSITKNANFFKSRTCYIIVPGDTIFDFNLLEEVLLTTTNNFNSIQNHPFVFYRKIGLIRLKELYGTNRIISYVEIIKIGSETILKKISQSRLDEFPSDNEINQVIPITTLSYELINDILKLNQNNIYNTVWETLNHIIYKGKKILAFEVESKYNFYDIDYANDLMKI